MKTEAFICKSPEVTGDVEEIPAGEDNDPDPGRPPRGNAKGYDGNGVNDFPFDPTPSTKE